MANVRAEPTAWLVLMRDTSSREDYHFNNDACPLGSRLNQLQLHAAPCHLGQQRSRNIIILTGERGQDYEIQSLWIYYPYPKAIGAGSSGRFRKLCAVSAPGR